MARVGRSSAAAVAVLAALTALTAALVVGAGGVRASCAGDLARGVREAVFDPAARVDPPTVSWSSRGDDLAFASTIARPGSGKVAFDFTVAAALVAKDDPAGTGFTLHDAATGAARFVLREFAVRDAAGRDVPASWEVLAGESGAPVVLRLALLLDNHIAPLTLAGRLAPSEPAPAFAEERSAPAPDAPPANDTCAGALPIPAGPYPVLGPLTSDVTSATDTGNPPAPTCQANVSRSVWYAFTPAATGTYSIATCADAGTGTTVDDTVLAVYTSSDGTCAGTFAQVAGGCDDDSCTVESNQSSIAGVTLTAGVKYFVVVFKYSTSAPTAGNTAVQPRIDFFAPPANDACADAPALALDTPLRATTANANDDYRLPEFSPCFLGIGQTASTAPGRDVVYRFTPPSDGTYSIRTTGAATSLNSVLYLAADCPAGTPPRTPFCLSASNRNAINGAEELACVALTGGTTYYVYADEHTAASGSGPGAGGPFTVEATRCTRESEPNQAPPAAGDAVCGIEGSIDPPGDADFFRLGSVPAGSRVFAMVDGVAANSTDLDLRVTTSADTLEYDDADNDAPFGSLAPNTSGTIATAGPAYLRVSYFTETAIVEPYRVYAVVQPPRADATPEAEPNEVPAAATTASRPYYAGTLGTPSDVDVFGVNAQAGQLLFVALDADPGRDGTPFNARLELLDPGGAVLVAVNDGDATSSISPGTGNLAATTPASPGEALTWRVRTAGRHFARVTSSGGTAGDYLLSISPDCTTGPPDRDGDGVADPDDCAPDDGTSWSPPGAAVNLRFPDPADKTALAWSPPAAPGATTVRYDLLRSGTPGNFSAPVCVSKDTAATTAADPAQPAPPGRLFAYLVRVENACGANSGTTSAGTPRSPGACP